MSKHYFEFKVDNNLAEKVLKDVEEERLKKQLLHSLRYSTPISNVEYPTLKEPIYPGKVFFLEENKKMDTSVNHSSVIVDLAELVDNITNENHTLKSRVESLERTLQEIMDIKSKYYEEIKDKEKYIEELHSDIHNLEDTICELIDHANTH